MYKNKRIVVLGVFLLAAILYPAQFVIAQSSSPSYRVEESYFGSGGGVDSTSPNYRARQSTGSLGVGNSSSNNYDAVSGFTTPSEPFIEMNVSGADVDLGDLSDTTPSVQDSRGGECNCSFTVRSYLSSDYTVVTASVPPTSENGNSLQAKSVLGAPSSNASVEEFGINLVYNSLFSRGAAPSNVPDYTFADGQAAPGYDTPNEFKYGLGDIIARSPASVGNQGVGQTNYTITYMAKISSITPAGKYVMQHDLIAVPSF